VRVDPFFGDQLSALPFEVPAQGMVPESCFAWSARLHTAACMTGSWGQGSELFDQRQLVVLMDGTATTHEIDLVDDHDAGVEEATDATPFPPRARTELTAAMRAGGYVSITSLRHQVLPNESMDFGRAAVRWRRRRTFAGGDNAAERYSDRFEIRFSPDDTFTTLGSTDDLPVEDTTLDVYAIPSTPYLLISAHESHGDEGEYGTVVRAWFCDRDAHACQ
jgi:hypothetical protein